MRSCGLCPLSDILGSGDITPNNGPGLPGRQLSKIIYDSIAQYKRRKMYMTKTKNENGNAFY